MHLYTYMYLHAHTVYPFYIGTQVLTQTIRYTHTYMDIHTHIGIETPRTQSADTDTLHPCLTRRLTLRAVHGEHHHLRQ